MRCHYMVRKTPLMYKNEHLPRTNIGKAEKRVAFFAGHRAGEGLRPDRCDHESRFFGWCVCVCVCVMTTDIICQDKLRTEITV